MLPDLETRNAAWWRENSLHHAIPGKDEFPEGFDAATMIGELFSTEKLVLDYGCGWGRLCRDVDSARYIGIDVSKTAVEDARRRYPNHRFYVSESCPITDRPSTVLLYTVLLHVADDELDEFARGIMDCEARRIVIAEITGRKWRNEPHAYNREVDEIVAAFDDYRLDTLTRLPYARYRTKDGFSIMDLRR